jgi:hypothetical protein
MEYQEDGLLHLTFQNGISRGWFVALDLPKWNIKMAV